MSFKSLIKYLIRFFFILISTNYLTIWYFDRFLILNENDKYLIYLNQIEDWNRFYSFVPESLITVDFFLILIVSIFISLLFATKFYTYVNELTLTLNKNYLQDFLTIYFLWSTYMFASFYIFRFNNLSRSSLIVFTFLVPIILILFRNTELLLLLFGRSTLNESFISFNLEEDSFLRNLRLLTFRKEIGNFDFSVEKHSSEIIKTIDGINKKNEVNLVVINSTNLLFLPNQLEEYLINLNKKVALISTNPIEFNKNFIYRFERLGKNYIYYFNNDIQYGSKYIIKRLIDIVLSFVGLMILMPIIFFVCFYIYLKDGFPILVLQNRIGLHGKKFKMFKFRSMKKDAHILRKELDSLNKKNGPLFKLENDPRLLPNANFIRKYSLDEIPQLLNVLKGDMSLVGPRPLFEEDTNYFDEKYMRRLNVLPGMTGLLQIKDRNTDDFEVWYQHDIQYIDNWSLSLDLKIIFKTIPSILKRKNSGI